MFSLHPFKTSDVRAFIEACQRGGSMSLGIERGSLGFEGMRRNDSRGPSMLTSGLALYLAERGPTFVFPDASLSKWEATIERGIGMYLRPPSRLFVDAGVERVVVRDLPIRLDSSGGMMGGSYVPAHLVEPVRTVLEARLMSQMRRMVEAEIDAVATMGLMLDALQFARESGAGLFEAADVVGPEVPGEFQLVLASRDRLPKEVRKRLEEAAKPPSKPGVLRRMFGARQAVQDHPAWPDNGSSRDDPARW
jgi:hypothetical protein